ncbi:MAG: L,D-transpeptidase family protein [Campylobacterota bacterium]|nr:L,D-transpeptidase family protein [Campylobacterota bacterium]
MKYAGIIIVLAVLFAGCSESRPKVKGKYYDIKECRKEMAHAKDIDESEHIDMIVVYKSKRKMDLYRSGRVVDTLPISLGKNPKGHKVRKGDHRTPEGQYWIRRKLCSQKYYRSLCISYPNPSDMNRAQAKRVDPGGDITIHAQPIWNADGNGNQYTLSKNWTEGCVAVTNQEMEKLWYAVREGVPIVIKK